jgi:hypothetical protein
MGAGEAPALQFNAPMGKATKESSKNRRWSAEVTKRSDALDLEPDVFKSKDPRKIALSLKRIHAIPYSVSKSLS